MEMATLVRFEPLREVAALHNEVSRLMNGLLPEGNGNGRTGRSWVPAVDVWETDDELVYAFDLPGIAEDKLSVELEDGVLAVTAERERSEEVQDERFYRYERRFGTFQRAITLPQGVTDDAGKADFRNGVLEVRFAKPEQPKPRRIPIGSPDQATVEA
jgi:HSP20 family protein